MENKNAQEILNQILKTKKKSDVAKEIGVNWVTVHYWSKGIFQPKPESLKKLLTLK